MNHAQVPGHDHNRVHDAPNDDRTPELTVNGDNSSNTSNTNNNINGFPSPALDSPTTPISNAIVPDVKIDIDYQEQESDARHEPMPIKSIDPVDKIDDASTVPQVGTPIDACRFWQVFSLFALSHFQLQLPSPYMLQTALHHHLRGIYLRKPRW